MRICKCGVKYSAKQYGYKCPVCPGNANKVWEILDIPVGEILIDAFTRDDIRYIVMRGPSSLCAYIGISEDHPLAGFDYDDIPLDCHGGLTFSRAGNGGSHPAGYYWYGWDYSHAWDAFTFYYDGKLKDIFAERLSFSNDKKWTVAQVEEQVRWVAEWDFRILAELAKKISDKEKLNHHLSITQLFLTLILPRHFNYLYK